MLTKTKQAANGSSARRQVYFSLLWQEVQRWQIWAGRATSLPRPRLFLALVPSSLVWPSSSAYNMATGTPAIKTTFQIDYRGRIKANAEYPISQLPLKSFPLSPTQWLPNICHWTQVCHMNTSTWKTGKSSFQSRVIPNVKSDSMITEKEKGVDR